jgi:hypothetical protein
MKGRRTMEGDSLKYDCAYAAGMLIYDRFLPEPDKPDALILGQLVFIVIEAINEFERRQGGIAISPNRLQADGGAGCEEQSPGLLRFFCPKCLRKFAVDAAHSNRRCLCPGCGKASITPGAKERN